MNRLFATFYYIFILTLTIGSLDNSIYAGSSKGSSPSSFASEDEYEETASETSYDYEDKSEEYTEESADEINSPDRAMQGFAPFENEASEETQAQPTLPSRPHFVINTIYYASSDSDEPDSPLTPTNNSGFTEENFKNLPFKFTPNDGEPSLPEANFYMPSTQRPSTVPLFLRNLERTGFQSSPASKEDLSSVSSSLLINRPFSLSERRNNFLRRELNRPETEYGISVKKHGVLWRRGQWHHPQLIWRSPDGNQRQWLNGQWIKGEWISTRLIQYRAKGDQWEQLGPSDDLWTGERLYERQFIQRYGKGKGDTRNRWLQGCWSNWTHIQDRQQTALTELSENLTAGSYTTRTEYIQIRQEQIEGQLFEGKWVSGKWVADWWVPEREILINVNDTCVRSFYRQLKKKYPAKAKEFLDNNERSQAVPYRWLRQILAQNPNTQELIRGAREHGAEDVYISLIDKDTLSFGGIYNSYQQLYNLNRQNPPQVMSTGYIFGNAPGLDPEIASIIRPLVIGSHLDRNVRSAIAQHSPQTLYYPEPNTCILIPRNEMTLPESFEDKESPEKQDAESPALLKQVKNRDGAWIFTNQYAPLVTAIPNRAARVKQAGKSLIDFSANCRQQGGVFTEDDLEKFGSMSQSHLEPFQLGVCLNINRGIALKGQGSPGKLKKDLAGIYSPKKSPPKISADLIPDSPSRTALEKGLNTSQTAVQNYRANLANNAFFDEIYNQNSQNTFLDSLRKKLVSANLIREAFQLAAYQQPTERNLVYRQENGTDLRLRELPVLGDGNCGFTAMGVDRAAAVNGLRRVLMDPSHQHFQNVIRALTAEVRENLAAADPGLAAFIQNYDPSPQELIEYMIQTYGTQAQGGRAAFLGYGLNRTGMMAAIAYVFEVEVQVFIPQENNELQRIFHYTPVTPRNKVHLLHTGAVAGSPLNHFNLLEIVESPPAVSSGSRAHQSSHAASF